MMQGSVELCSIYVDLNFGVTSIGTQCIYFMYSEYMFTTYHQHICLLLLKLLLLLLWNSSC